MKQYKIRRIIKSKNREVFGITIPDEILAFYSPNTYFSYKIFNEENKVGFLLISGSKIEPTKEEIKSYEFEDIKI